MSSSIVNVRETEHTPSAQSECSIGLAEKTGTRSPGDAGGDRTAPDGVWT